MRETAVGREQSLSQVVGLCVGMFAKLLFLTFGALEDTRLTLLFIFNTVYCWAILFANPFRHPLPSFSPSFSGGKPTTA